MSVEKNDRIGQDLILIFKDHSAYLPVFYQKIIGLLVSNLIVAPLDINSFLIFSRMILSMSVPIWGFCTHKISSGAPNETNVFNICSKYPDLSLFPVFNFPVGKLPAPPSPDKTLEARSSSLRFQRRDRIFFCLFFTSLPRSNITGLSPILLKVSAAKILRVRILL